MKSNTKPDAVSKNFIFGDIILILSIIVSCTLPSGRKGTKENRNIKDGGILIKKLKEIAAARSGNFKDLKLLKNTAIISNIVAPLAPGNLVRFKKRMPLSVIF